MEKGCEGDRGRDLLFLVEEKLPQWGRFFLLQTRHRSPYHSPNPERHDAGLIKGVYAHCFYMPIINQTLYLQKGDALLRVLGGATLG